MGVPHDRQGPHPSPPPMPRIRDPVKSKKLAPPAVPIEALLGEYPDVALAWWLQQEEYMAEAVQMGEDPESLHGAQKLATAE